MSQLIYSILALSVTVLFSVSLNRVFNTNTEKTYTNEVLSQMIGVGQDVLEEVGRRGLPFDEAVDEARYVGPIRYPLVHAAFELTPASAFGMCDSGCTDPLDLDDYDGMTFYRTVDSLDYIATVSVQYVDELDPTKVSATQTFAKLVTVEVSSEAIAISGEPLTIDYSRVFTYERSTMDTPDS